MTSALIPSATGVPGTAPFESVRFPAAAVLDGVAVEDLHRRIRQITVAPRWILIDCVDVKDLQPVGAALLWLLCREIEHACGSRLFLLDLPPMIERRLRNHPLRDYLAGEESLFLDPFAEPSRR